MSTEHHLRARAGETYSRVFEYQQPDGTPVDLHGSTARFQILSRATGERFYAVDRVSPEDGTFEVHIPEEDTADWTPGVHAYALIIESGNVDVTRLLGGRFTIRGMHNV